MTRQKKDSVRLFTFEEDAIIEFMLKLRGRDGDLYAVLVDFLKREMKRIENGVTIALGQQKERDQRCGAHGNEHEHWRPRFAARKKIIYKIPPYIKLTIIPVIGSYKFFANMFFMYNIASQLSRQISNQLKYGNLTANISIVRQKLSNNFKAIFVIIKKLLYIIAITHVMKIFCRSGLRHSRFLEKPTIS